LDEAAAILEGARAGGVDMLDTAIAYGDSEARLGELGTEGFHIVSKLPPLPDKCVDVAAWVEAQVRGSVERLGCVSLWGLLLHHADDLVGPRGGELYEALSRVRRDGLVQRIGVSIYAPAELDGLAGFDLDVVQAPFNVFDTSLRDSGWLRRLADEGTEVHVRSIFLQGLLLMSDDQRPAKFGRWSAVWSRWDAWVAESGMSPLEVCVRHALSFTEISRVVVGVDSVRQLRDLLGAAAQDARALQLPDFHAAYPDLINPSRWALL
jgi:aryl-alcohol dehydrogenase-like predicted oxidoreductase